MPTREQIDAAMTPGGGWTRAQLAEWGVPWPPPKGWRKELEAKAKPEWRCFYCDEVFTTRKHAAEHFGADETCTTACLLSHEGHLVRHIRNLESQLSRRRDDDSDVMRAMMALEGAHATALVRAEEAGYAKGVSEMKAQGLCPEPGRHQ